MLPPGYRTTELRGFIGRSAPTQQKKMLSAQAAAKGHEKPVNDTLETIAGSDGAEVYGSAIGALYGKHLGIDFLSTAGRCRGVAAQWYGTGAAGTFGACIGSAAGFPCCLDLLGRSQIRLRQTHAFFGARHLSFVALQ
jgi:hypothetical protein